MTVATRAPSDGGTTGFRRLQSYRNAVPVDDVRALLDPLERDIPRRADLRSRLTNLQAASAADLERISLELPWRDSRDLAPRCRPDLAFALALDRPGRPRLSAIVARAFSRADPIAAACADELEIRADAPRLSAEIGRALGILDEASTVRQALDVVDRMRWDRDGEATERRDDVERGMSALRLVAGTLASLTSQGPAFGWPLQDEARFFLVLRIAELVAIATGHVPTFHAQPRKDGRPTWTLDAVRAALEFTRIGATNLDELFRRLGGRRPEMIQASIEESYADILAEEAKWAGETILRGAGELLTAGRAIDRKLGEEPDRWT